MARTVHRVVIHIMYMCIIFIYVHMYAVKPVIEIVTATGGCGHVDIRWTKIGRNNEVCSTVQYNLTLSSVTVDVSTTILTTANSHTFIGLPDDILFNVILFGHNVFGLQSNLVVTSVRTISMYIRTCM